MDNIQNVINDTTDIICYIEQAKAVILGIQAIMDNFDFGEFRLLIDDLYENKLSTLENKITDSICAIDTLITLSHDKAVLASDKLADIKRTETKGKSIKSLLCQH
ncbi:MAG: hypothetical protein IJC04_06900 [Oscillospiraceae bacterium]|nr:hypothetical protein [Oscillospiraceae bacterium]